MRALLRISILFFISCSSSSFKDERKGSSVENKEDGYCMFTYERDKLKTVERYDFLNKKLMILFIEDNNQIEKKYFVYRNDTVITNTFVSGEKVGADTTITDSVKNVSWRLVNGVFREKIFFDEYHNFLKNVIYKRDDKHNIIDSFIQNRCELLRDRSGQLLKKTSYFMNDVLSVVSYEYDSLSRLKREHLIFLKKDKITKSMFIPSEISYTYDNNGFLAEKKENALDKVVIYRYSKTDDREEVKVSELVQGGQPVEINTILKLKRRECNLR